MFRMEFQSLDDVEEADEPCSSTDGHDEENSGNRVIDEQQCRQNRAVESKESQAPKIHEGQVGGPEFGTMHATMRVQSTSDLPPVLITHSVSTNDALPMNWVEVDLINFESPKPGAQQVPPPADPVVITDLVAPFAESVNIEVQSMEAVSESLPRTNSIHSTSSSTSDAESRGYVKDEEKGSPATRAYNRAFNKIMHKKSKQEGSIKQWDEPLLAAHEHAKLQRKKEKEAKRDAEIQQRELLELANPRPESALNHKKDHGVRKGIQKLFHIHGSGTHSNQNSPKETAIGDVRESKLVMPRRGLIESSLMSPSTTTSSTDILLSQIRTAPRPTARKDITFATVESNQRDVQPWTMEEYMAKNARQAEWGNRVNDEEFGGIEGNQLLNQYFDDDVKDDFDSDSD